MRHIKWDQPRHLSCNRRKPNPRWPPLQAIFIPCLADLYTYGFTASIRSLIPFSPNGQICYFLPKLWCLPTALEVSKAFHSYIHTQDRKGEDNDWIGFQQFASIVVMNASHIYWSNVTPATWQVPSNISPKQPCSLLGNECLQMIHSDTCLLSIFLLVEAVVCFWRGWHWIWEPSKLVRTMVKVRAASRHQDLFFWNLRKVCVLLLPRYDVRCKA
jgi:hypothetical protein